jgi:hypothetical protein
MRFDLSHRGHREHREKKRQKDREMERLYISPSLSAHSVASVAKKTGLYLAIQALVVSASTKPFE